MPRIESNPNSLAAIDATLRGGLVVSCQPVDNGPMDRDDIVVALACAAIAGGAAGVRIEGVARVAAVKQAFAASSSLASSFANAAVIGIVKRDLADSPVRITPWIEDVAALGSAGADIIAVDGTARARPASLTALLAAIRDAGALAMADCSNLDDALAAAALGFDIVGTTLSGYTGSAQVRATDPPDLNFVRTLAAHRSDAPHGLRIMAEGRFNAPQQARAAIDAGAWAVTVGSAITRTEVVTGWFTDAISNLEGRDS
jgi:N-acylglucosamine-6-phosphate 2-epimerase